MAIKSNGAKWLALILLLGAASLIADDCANFSGSWKRDVDGLTWNLSQQTDEITGGEDNGVYRHEIHGRATGRWAGLEFERTQLATGCVMYLVGIATRISDDEIQIQASGSGCDLKDYTENYVYHRVK